MTVPGFEPPNYAVVEGTEAATRGFFPNRRQTPTPAGAADIRVTVAPGVHVACRFHAGRPNGPSVLFFHGNGETVYDYDDIALLFTQTGLNLFLADYRGYGASTGAPTFPSMLGDAHALHRAFHTVLDDRGLGPRRFVMGRSMGGHSAVELAAYYPQQLSGLILDSSAPNISRLLDYLESVGDHATATSLAAQHLAKVQAIAVPTLALHGEWDDLIPIGRAIEFFDLLTMPNKHLIRIPGAGHNDILWVGMQQYLAAVQEFVGA